MSTLAAAIIGCGVIAPTHAKSLLLDGRVRIRWACDPDTAKARQRIPAADKVTGNLAEVLADPTVDLVCICTPHADHAAPLRAAIAAGKHVICEKPLGVSPDQVRQMVADAEAAQAKGLVMAGIFQHRFNPLVARLQALVAAGDFGAIRSARMDFRCTRTQAYYDSGAWRGKWASEGGATLINQAIHTIDVVNWICGEPVAVRGTVEQRVLRTIECEDHADFTVRYAGGHEAVFHAANDGKSGWVTDVHVDCERGAFSLGKGCYALTRLEHPSAVLRADISAHDQLRERITAVDDNGGKTEYGDFHTLQIADAVSAVIARRRPRFTIADAARSVHVVLGAYHAAATGREAALPVVGTYSHPVFTSTAASSKV